MTALALLPKVLRYSLAILACKATALAQSGAVSNALSPSPDNVLAPQMLANLTEFSFSQNTPVSNLPATVFIRPAGSMSALPANVVTAGIEGSPFVTFIVPAGVPIGSAQLYWQIDGGPFRSSTVVVKPNNFFLADETRVLAPNGSSSLVTFSSPARPGQTVVLTGSGLGYGTSVTAKIADVPSRVIYAGHGPKPGFDTIHLEIPPNIAGCTALARITIDTREVLALLSVSADGAPCRHPLPFTSADLKTLDSGASLSAARLSLSSALVVTSADSASRTEAASLMVHPTNGADLISAISPGTTCADVSFGQGAAAPPPGIAINGGGSPSVAPTTSAINLPAPLPDLGTAISLSGPTGTYPVAALSASYFTTTFPTLESSFAASPQPRLAVGKWLFSTQGSPDLAPSSLTFNLPGSILIAGPAVPNVLRASPGSFSWNGTAFRTDDIVGLYLSGTSSGGTRHRALACTAPARSGTITIPAALLADFDPASIGSLNLVAIPNQPLLSTRLITANGAPLIVTVNYTSSDTRPVDFQ